MPPASRITDLHTCPVHQGGPVSSGSPDTLIAYARAARVTDRIACGGAEDVIRNGSSNVFINHLEAARIGDPTTHGGLLATGAPNVIIGETAQSQALLAAAYAANTFVEECPYAKAAGDLERAAAAAESEGGGQATDEPPELPSNPYATTEEERELAAAEGDSQEVRAAREKVVREYYEAHAKDGLGGARADQDLGVGGVPPRANAHPKGFAIDLAKPVTLVALPASGQVSMLVRRLGRAAGALGNVVDPSPATERPADETPSPNALTGLRKKVVLDLPAQGGIALQTIEGPIVDGWSDSTTPQSTSGGGTRWTLPNTLKESLRCVVCGSPPDASSPQFVALASGRVVPRRCAC